MHAVFVTGFKHEQVHAGVQQRQTMRVVHAMGYATGSLLMIWSSRISSSLPVVLAATVVDQLFIYVEDNEGFQLTVDLPAQTISIQDGEAFNFEIDGFRKNCLLNGLDEIGLTLESRDEIKRYEEKRRHEAPWLFDVITRG